MDMLRSSIYLRRNKHVYVYDCVCVRVYMIARSKHRNTTFMAEIISTFILQLKLLAWARTFDGGPVAGLWQSVCVCVCVIKCV